MRSFDNKAKVAVVCVFTVFWLFVIVLRGQFAGGETKLDASWLMGLAASFQQGLVSGRDFHFTYGPAAQLLAWLATSATATNSAFDAYRMLTVFYIGACALLAGAVLLLLNRISWKQTIVIYCIAALLNLYWGIPNFRTTLLLLCVVLAYRTAAAETFRRQLAWAGVTGFACFVSQLVTLDIGLYGFVTSVGILATGYLASREIRTIKLGGVLIATFVVLNISIDVFFKLTSAHYSSLFDYQRYAFEMINAYNNTMGLEWQLDRGSTIFLALLGLYTLATAAIAVVRSTPLDRSLLAGLVIASVISIKSAFVRSDEGHIIFGAGPLFFTFLLLGKKEWNPRVGQIIWCAFALGLWFVWPGGSWDVPRDFLRGIKGELSLVSAIREMSSVSVPPENVLPPELLTPEFRTRRSVPILPFPYENYIPVALHRPLFAPVLQSYIAPTEALQKFYIDAVERQRPAGLDVVYALDDAAVWPVDGIKSITRVPKIFEYLYTHFQLASIEEHRDGRYVLHPRQHQKTPVIQNLEFTTIRSGYASGSLRLKQPTACGLIRLEIAATYSPARLLLRPGGVEFGLTKGDEPVSGWLARPAELNQPFTTYVSFIHPSKFYKVFESTVIPMRSWDRINYLPWQTDALGTAPWKVEISRVECVDPQMFVEGTPEGPVEEELQFSPDVMAGTTQHGYVVLTPESKSVPQLTAGIGFAGGTRSYVRLPSKPATTIFSSRLDSVFAKDVGIAIVNPGQTALEVRIAYRDDENAESTTVRLPAGYQVTKLLGELLPLSRPKALSGILQLSSSSRFAALALRFSGERFGELAPDGAPVTATSDQKSIVFPQFAMYGGWATTLTLSNRTDDAAAGRIRIFSPTGRPMPVTLNGVTSNEFKYSVSPNTTFTFSPVATPLSSSR